MSLWNSFKIAFSMYSKIWMPKTDWTKENMKYAMCFFPCIGFVIGLLEIVWFMMYQWLDMGVVLYASISALIPIVISGGIHMDGLMDTSDALHSYQSKDRKLEILKDPHTGAFAILCAILYMLLLVAVFSEVEKELIVFLPFIFIISRACSGMAVATFPMAKNTGLAATFQNAAHKKAVAYTMIVYLVLSMLIMCYINLFYAIGIILAAACMVLYYKHMAMKQFGGITGDLAGYFLQWAEVAMLASVVAIHLILKTGLL